VRLRTRVFARLRSSEAALGSILLHLHYTFAYQGKDLGFGVDDCRTWGLGLVHVHSHYDFAHQGKDLGLLCLGLVRVHLHYDLAYRGKDLGFRFDDCRTQCI
jgi:hypothetical protein